MALIVQDDTGTVVDANGYISVAFFKAYHTDRGIAAVVDSEYSDTEIEAAIVQATDYIDTSRNYKFTPLTDEQTTEFPREELGFPVQLQKACAEYALRALIAGLAGLAPDIARNAERVVSTMSKVGPLEERTSYLQTGSGGKLLLSYPAADMLLKNFVDSGASTMVIR